jgi:ribonuclease III
MTRSAKGALELALGYHFKDSNLLRMALTPPSTGIQPNNQRLEFMGDAILQFCISRILYREQPRWEEGALSKLRGMLVCTESLREWAQSLGLTLERGPRSSKSTNTTQGKPLADALEALLAAVYLDAEQAGEDAIGAVLALIESRFTEVVRKATPDLWESRDTKTTLQERAAAASLPAPVYELLQRSGPDHQPRFQVRVKVGSYEAQAEAGTLKRAQIEAARILLEQLNGG